MYDRATDIVEHRLTKSGAKMKRILTDEDDVLFNYG